MPASIQLPSIERCLEKSTDGGTKGSGAGSAEVRGGQPETRFYPSPFHTQLYLCHLCASLHNCANCAACDTKQPRCLTLSVSLIYGPTERLNNLRVKLSTEISSELLKRLFIDTHRQARGYLPFGFI